MKILFVGGGSLGPVTPLLATAEALRTSDPTVTCLWIGTPDGPERALVEEKGIAFESLPVAKFPRYPSLEWLTFPFDWLRARSRATDLVRQMQPDAVVTVGGFTAVPVVFAAVRSGIPCLTHQLDVIPGLSNRKIAKLCKSVTTSFEYEKAPFGEWVSDERISTPTRVKRQTPPTRAKAAKIFGLDPKRPIVLVTGGGTGAQALNEMMQRTLSKWLEFTQIIHLTGTGKASAEPTPGYATRSLLLESDMLAALSVADLVVSRAGLGSLTDMSALKKAMILVPMPNSHQEINAKAFEEKGAAVVLHQGTSDFDETMLATARLLMVDEEERAAMGERASAFLPTDDGSELAGRVRKAVGAVGK